MELCRRDGGEGIISISTGILSDTLGVRLGRAAFEPIYEAYDEIWNRTDLDLDDLPG